MKRIMIEKVNVYHIFDELEALVKANGWNMHNVAKKANVTDATITRLRRKKAKNPQIETVNRLIEAYELMLKERKEKTGR